MSHLSLTNAHVNGLTKHQIQHSPVHVSSVSSKSDRACQTLFSSRQFLVARCSVILVSRLKNMCFSLERNCVLMILVKRSAIKDFKQKCHKNCRQFCKCTEMGCFRKCVNTKQLNSTQQTLSVENVDAYLGIHECLLM